MPSLTCLSCQVFFADGDLQRAHFKTDWHRYNLKRKVAELPSVTELQFTQQKDLEIRDTNQVCTVCQKSYASANAYTNHLSSKKHILSSSKLQLISPPVPAIHEVAVTVVHDLLSEDNKSDTSSLDVDATLESLDSMESLKSTLPTFKPHPDSTELSNLPATNTTASPFRVREEKLKEIRQKLTEADSEEEIEALLLLKRSLSPSLSPDVDCLFCTHQSSSMEENLAHMTDKHSFFIPDVEFLVDLRGLVDYLGQKVAVENMCLYCNGKGRSFHSIDSVRDHMVSKNHTMLSYEEGADLEYSDFYDFSSTWEHVGHDDDDDYEDTDEEMDDDDAVVVERDERRVELKKIEINPVTSELKLPSGTVLGHRTYLRYYKQHFRPQNEAAALRDSVLIQKLVRQYHEMDVVEKTARKSEERGRKNRDNFTGIVGIKANKLQRYFRRQVDF